VALAAEPLYNVAVDLAELLVAGVLGILGTLLGVGAGHLLSERGRARERAANAAGTRSALLVEVVHGHLAHLAAELENTLETNDLDRGQYKTTAFQHLLPRAIEHLPSQTFSQLLAYYETIDALNEMKASPREPDSDVLDHYRRMVVHAFGFLIGLTDVLRRPDSSAQRTLFDALAGLEAQLDEASQLSHWSRALRRSKARGIALDLEARTRTGGASAASDTVDAFLRRLTGGADDLGWSLLEEGGRSATFHDDIVAYRKAIVPMMSAPIDWELGAAISHANGTKVQVWFRPHTRRWRILEVLGIASSERVAELGGRELVVLTFEVAETAQGGRIRLTSAST
jgi:hypothetical protein